MYRDRISTIIRYTTLHGGGTFTMDHADPIEATGWAVGDKFYGRTWNENQSPWSLAWAIDHVLILAAAPFIGTWIDDDGTWHIDPVTIVEDREDAIALAVENGERAIYNLGTSETVYIDGLPDKLLAED